MGPRFCLARETAHERSHDAIWQEGCDRQLPPERLDDQDRDQFHGITNQRSQAARDRTTKLEV